MTLEKIQHIIKFIEENYARTIPIEELEDIACYSYRNLQRVFKNIFKESLGEFQKRLKLENGYKKIIFTNDSITDIAFSVGFESLQAFTKSFKKQYNISPIKAKDSKQILFKDYIVGLNEVEKIPYEIVYLSPIKVFYKSIKTANYTNREIEKLWKIVDEVYENNSDVRYFGIIVDQTLITPHENCRYEAAIDKAPHVPDKTFATKMIFGRRYLKFLHRGSYDTIEETYRQLFKSWLFEKKLEFDSSPIIEYYLKYDVEEKNEEDLITEIYIPLKSK